MFPLQTRTRGGGGDSIRPRPDALTPLNAPRTRASDSPELWDFGISALRFLPLRLDRIVLGFKVGFCPDAGNPEVAPASPVDDTSAADCRSSRPLDLDGHKPFASPMTRVYAWIWNKGTPATSWDLSRETRESCAAAPTFRHLLY